jgi:CheY-like chemotaxis protein
MLHFAHRTDPVHVLCVEEDAVQRKLFGACLDVVGAEAVFASSAAHALSLFRRYDIDLVLMDFDRHAAAELAAFEEMRDTPNWHVPILAVTDNECRWSEASYREVGFAGLYVKPVEPTRLIAAMDGALREAGQPPLLLHDTGLLEPNRSYMH